LRPLPGHPPGSAEYRSAVSAEDVQRTAGPGQMADRQVGVLFGCAQTPMAQKGLDQGVTPEYPSDAQIRHSR
jgi:hypothetical protein